MVRLHVQQGHRDHGDLFLSEDASVLSLTHHESVELLEARGLAHLDAADIVEAVRELVRVPFNFGGMLTNHTLVLQDRGYVLLQYGQGPLRMLINRV